MAQRFEMEKDRFETLIDGIFAIAMTILILEVKVPELADPRSVSELVEHLRHAAPTILAYLFSFFVLGKFWLWHHAIFRNLTHVDRTVIWLSITFASAVAFFPFAAGLFGHYARNPGFLIVYFPALMVMVYSQAATTAIALRHGLVDPERLDSMRLSARRGLRASLGITVAATPAALVLGPAAIAVQIALFVLGMVLLRTSKT